MEKRMHPFLASELGESFSLESALTEGLVPVVLRHANRREALLSYLALYVREEVQIEGLTRNLGAFIRFLEAVSFSHGSILSATDVSRECGVKRMTVEGYIGILEDLLVATRLPCFQKHAKRRLVAHDKFYFFDTGLFRAVRPKGAMDRPEEIAGMALEGLVHQHLRAWCDYSGWDGSLFFWRSAEGAEVDFVVYSEDCFLALEVKHTDRPIPTDFSGLKTFGRDYPLARRVLLYRGRERYLREDGILVVPVDEFLRKLVPGQLPFEG